MMRGQSAMTHALVLDFDGVIADTEPLHFRAFQETLEPEKLAFVWADYLSTYMGFDDRDAFRTRFKNAGRKVSAEKLAGLIAKKAEAFRRLARISGVKPYPGVRELLAAAREKKIPAAICSGALRSDIEPVLEANGLKGEFALMVTADDVPASKPDPACYRLVVERLGVAPRTALAVEDSPAGIAAAKGAGLRVIAVTNSHGRDKLFGADRIVSSLTTVRL
jgi:beta-phosphoglucomutase